MVPGDKVAETLGMVKCGMPWDTGGNKGFQELLAQTAFKFDVC